MLNDYLPSSCLHYVEQHGVKLCQRRQHGKPEQGDIFSFPFLLKKWELNAFSVIGKIIYLETLNGKIHTYLQMRLYINNLLFNTIPVVIDLIFQKDILSYSELISEYVSSESSSHRKRLFVVVSEN